MKRGDIVTIELQGDYGKPRPALVIQSDLFGQHPSVTIMPITSELREAALFRITIDQTLDNGLRQTSQIMIDKVQTVASNKIGKEFGFVSDDEMVSINRALLLWLGLA